MDLDADPDPRILTFDGDPVPDPVLFISYLQDANKKYFFFSRVLYLFLFEGTFRFNDKSS
jgi:hypothetical protein